MVIVFAPDFAMIGLIVMLVNYSIGVGFIDFHGSSCTCIVPLEIFQRT